MSETPQDDWSPLREDDSLEKAHKLVNTVTLNRTSSDFARALPKQQVDTLRPTRENSSSNADRGRSSYAEAHGLLIDDTFEVVRPLDNKLTSLVGLGEKSPQESSPADDSSMVTRLNQAMVNAQVLWELHSAFVLGVGPSVVVKISPSLDPDDITNLEYINANVPEVPAPLCLGSLLSKRRTYFFMSRAEGVTLEAIWPQLSTAQKSSVQEQLNDILWALRAKLPNPHEDREDVRTIGSFTSGACKVTRKSLRLSDSLIHTEAEFNDFVCFDPARTITPWIKMIRSSMREDHRMVMTHGDLHPRNIMVKLDADEFSAGEGGGSGDVRVTALIDWELSGWYPEYWEFVKALSTVDVRGPLADWYQYLPTEAIGSWLVEFSIDSLIARWLG